MTDISGIGSVSGALIRAAIQNEELERTQLKVQKSDQDGQELAQRRIEQVRKGSEDNDLGLPGNAAFNFDADNVQKQQVNDVVNNRIRREEVAVDNILQASRRADLGIEITLSNSLERAQESAVRITTENTFAAEKSLQDGIAQTEASLNSDDFTRTVDDNRDREDASNLESRANRELGRVVDTFA